jgi:thiamine biosynthesis lipoprotein ApbE
MRPDLAASTSARPQRREAEPQLGCASWQALGTSVVLRVCDAAAIEPARAAVAREIGAIDAACSRFRCDSELVRLNARAGRRTLVSALLLQALAVAMRAAELTDGDVDPTVGRALELAGYDRDWSLLAAPGAGARDGSRRPATHARRPTGHAPRPIRRAPRLTARVRAGWQTIELDERSSTVRVPRGIRLDLGASAKAWAADRGAAAASLASGCGALLSLGGDIATCGAPPAGGWKVHVTDDHRNDCSAPGQTIVLDSGGLATSSTAVRRWRQGGHGMHHIIDPASGAPVQASWRTVSVAAADCTDANIAATASIVRAARACAWLAELRLPARLVDCAGNVTRVAGWPE